MQLSSKPINFSLVENAQDSISTAINLLAWKAAGNENSQLKQSVLSIAHAIELLLKERLRRENKALVWEDIDKFPSMEARTVTVDKAINRLRKIVGISISEHDERLLKSLRTTRNAIEHFEWSTTEAEVKTIVGCALSFALNFAKDQLGHDLAYAFKRDDTWQQLILELESFAVSHGRRIQSKLSSSGAVFVYCETCAQITAPIMGGACELCGHWNSADDEPPF